MTDVPILLPAASGKPWGIRKRVIFESLPRAVTKQATYTSSNGKYAPVSKKGVVTVKKAGAGKKVTITAQTKKGGGASAKLTVRIMRDAVKKITLKASAYTVKPGKKVQIKATVLTTGKKANKALEWYSSNKKYAAVNQKGIVTAKKAGKGKHVVITAKATDGTGKQATIKIKIRG